MHTTRTLTIVLSSFVVCFGALAEQSSDKNEVRAGSTFKRLDVNADGKIDRREADTEPDMASQFNVFDANHDGVITPEEVQAYDEAARARKADKGKKPDGVTSPSRSDQGTGKNKP